MLTALASLLIAPAPAEPAEPPEASFVIIAPSIDGLGDAADSLIGETERLLIALQEEGRLRYRRSAVAPGSLRTCFTGEVEPSEERRACLRRLLPGQEAGAPVVAIVINYTLARGAWQRMECVGPGSAGFERTIYVNQANHPRPDIRASARNDGLRCITDALAGSPGEPADASSPQRLLATLNWDTCLEERARRVALQAVDARGPVPGPEAVFEACSPQEAEVLRASPGTANGLRAQAAERVRHTIETTYRAHNYD